MGASGRGVYSKKQTVEGQRRLSVFTLYRQGVLAGTAGSWTLSWTNQSGETVASIGIEILTAANHPSLCRLSYGFTPLFGPPVNVAYVVRITTTRCYYGGFRHWFLCPAEVCGRRVAKLYLPPSARYFLCRHCHQLTYEARQKHRNRIYESFERHKLHRRRLEGARTKRQREKWFARMQESSDQARAYYRKEMARFNARLKRQKGKLRPQDSQGLPYTDANQDLRNLLKKLNFE